MGWSPVVLICTTCDCSYIFTDPRLEKREYISKRARYSTADFSEHDWSGITERSLAFFDDHQNALRRLQQCQWFGFRHAIFEDNYPPGRGNCYSLKMAFAGAGHQPTDATLKNKLGRFASETFYTMGDMAILGGGIGIPNYRAYLVRPGNYHALTLHQNLEVYAEFPPLVRTTRTLWGDEWTQDRYPTPEPLLQEPFDPALSELTQDPESYNWICYAQLKA